MLSKPAFLIPEKDLQKADKWERFSLICAWLVIFSGFTALLGWCFDISSFCTFLSDGIAMKVNTAQMLILSGLSLVLLQKPYPVLTRTILIVVQIFSIAIVYEHLSGQDLHIDQMLFRDYHHAKLEAPGRTSLLTALYLLLASSAMLLSSFRKYYAAQFASTTLIVLVYISLLGHLFSGFNFLSGPGDPGMAFHTALSLLLLAGGTIILKPREGWIRLLYRQLIPKNLLIYLLSYILGTVPLFAALYLFVIRNSTIAPASDMLVLFLLTLVLSVPVAYFLLRLFKQLNEDVRGAHEQLRIAVHASGLGAWEIDLATGALSHSDKFAQFFGITGEPITTMQSLWARFHPADAEVGRAAFQHAVISGQLDIQIRLPIENGRVNWIQFYGETQRDRNGSPLRLIGTAMDITQRKELEQKKDQFISVASHELKTPLTSLKSYVQIAHVMSDQLVDPTISGMLGKAEIQINKMTRMIVDFLNAAQSEAGKMILHQQEFLLDDLAREVIADMAVSFRGHQIRLDDCPPLKIIADREKIEQVMVNLIGNAIKYSIGDEPIRLSCQRNNDRVLISIDDHGVGISEEDKLHLFNRFFRAENPNTRTVSGFGIGLYLSSEIVKLHGGNIGVNSEIGKGSSFWFELPAMASANNSEPEMIAK